MMPQKPRFVMTITVDGALALDDPCPDYTLATANHNTPRLYLAQSLVRSITIGASSRTFHEPFTATKLPSTLIL